MKVRDRNHLADLSRWFVSVTFEICGHNFPRREVSVKVDVMEFGLIQLSNSQRSITEGSIIHLL